MSRVIGVNISLLIILSIVNAGENDLSCPCDTEEEKKHKNDLWEWLKKLETQDLPDAEKVITPGYLHQFDCTCDENWTHILTMEEFEDKKRRVREEARKEEEELAKKKEEEVELAIEVVRDSRCPENTVWVAAAKTCIPDEDD